MKRQGLRLLDQVIVHLNSPSASPSLTRQLHAYLLKSDNINNAFLTTKLLSLYANNLCFREANLVLGSLPHPDLFCFSTLIHASSKLGRFSLSLRLFSRMLSRQLFPDAFLFPSLVKASSGLPSLEAGKQLHAFACVFGFCFDSFVQSSLLHMYLKCDRIRNAHKIFDGMPLRDLVTWSALISAYSSRGFLDEAKALFYEMRMTGVEPNVVTWNGLISGFSRNGLCSEAVGMFRRMHSEGFPADGSSVSSVLPAIGSLEDLNMGIQVHGYMVKRGFGLDKCVTSALIDMYGKCSRAVEMSRIFNGMEQMDVGAFNAFVTGKDVLYYDHLLSYIYISVNFFVGIEMLKNEALNIKNDDHSF